MTLTELSQISNSPPAYTQADTIRQQISCTFARTGQQGNKEKCQFMLSETTQMLQDNYKKLTIAEFEYLMQQGAYGHYGGYFGVTSVQIKNWIDSYLQSPEYKQLHEPKPTIAIDQKSTLTEYEKNEICLDFCVEIWNDYKIRRVYDRDFHGVVFNTLEKNKLLVLPTEVKWKYLNQAKGIVEKEENERRGLLGRIHDAMQARLGKPSTFAQIIAKQGFAGKCQTLAKRLAVQDLFEDLIKNNLELEVR